MQNILVNLDILSNIKPNDKIFMNTDNYISIEYDSVFQGLKRYFYNNSRAKNIDNLNNFYSIVYNYIDDTINSKYLISSSVNKTNNLCTLDHRCDFEDENFQSVYNNMVEINHYIKRSVNGLENLKKTYISDVVTVSKINIIINNIEIYIVKISKKIKNLDDFKRI